MKRSERWSEGCVVKQARDDCLLERDGCIPFQLNEMRDRRVLRPGEKKDLLIGNRFAQDFRPFLSAVDFFLVPPDGNVRIALELGLKLLNERQVCA